MHKRAQSRHRGCDAKPVTLARMETNDLLKVVSTLDENGVDSRDQYRYGRCMHLHNEVAIYSLSSLQQHNFPGRAQAVG